MNMTKEQLEFVKDEADKTMEFHLKNLEALQQEAHVTLTFLFVVISASFSGATALFQKEGAAIWAWAMTLLCFYLGSIAIYLTMRCLKTKELWPPGNTPNNLIPHFAKFDLEAVQETALELMDERIKLNSMRCKETGNAINNTRVAIIASILVFPVSALLVMIVRSSCGL